jgi:hypothetical protein
MRKLLPAITAAIAVLAAASPAHAIGKGTSMLSLQLGNGIADLVQPSGDDYITSFQVSVVEPNIEYSYLFKDDYAFRIGAGMSTFKETDEPGDSAPPDSPDLETTVSGFFVRMGGDRIVKVGERAVLYFGPGLEFWSGKYEFTAGPFTEESESTTRISLAGRVGGTMMLGETWGFTCNVGRRVGIASAEWDGAKASWWPSSTNASGGLVFQFGGN